MADIETRVTEVEKKQAVTDAKIDAFIQEMRDFKNEMRQQNEMRANEIRDLQKRQEEDRRKHDADMKAEAFSIVGGCDHNSGENEHGTEQHAEQFLHIHMRCLHFIFRALRNIDMNYSTRPGDSQ